MHMLLFAVILLTCHNKTPLRTLEWLMFGGQNPETILQVMMYVHGNKIDIVMLYLRRLNITFECSLSHCCHKCTLLAKKLCNSSFLGKILDLIHSHFKTDRVISFIF